MWLIPLSLGVLCILGVLEKKRHRKNLSSISIRVNVNGIRGKSTITRLITSIFIDAGYRTLGKTTGTAARLIYWDRETEEPIRRRLEGPNISEQIRIVEEAAKRGAECLVSECMAVNPDYQIVFQEEMVCANIGVISNVREDHMDVMGPTLDEVAEALTATIPYQGHLVISQGPYVDYFTQEAYKRETQVHIADPSDITEGYLEQFDYMLFPENAAISLKVAEVLGIDKEMARRGMLKACADPGSVRILTLGNQVFFVNGFAANDPVSTLHIWERLSVMRYPVQRATVIMNCRADRVDRTIQFVRDVLPHLSIDRLVVTGEVTTPVMEAFAKGLIRPGRIDNLENRTAQEVFDRVKTDSVVKLIYGIGNIHGVAESLCSLFEQEHLHTKKDREHVDQREKVYVGGGD